MSTPFTGKQHRPRRQLEDFQVDRDDVTHSHQNWHPKPVTDEPPNGPPSDYEAEYIDAVEPPKRKRRSSGYHYPTYLTNRDLVRLERDIQEQQQQESEEDEDDVDVEDDDYRYTYEEERRRRRRRRRKRDEQSDDQLEEQQRPRCNPDITTLTVGCSNADRMEFQSDCVDEDFVTGTGRERLWYLWDGW